MSPADTQSEALRLADRLEGHSTMDARDLAAAELRLMDAEIRALKLAVSHESLCVEAAKEHIAKLGADNKALHAESKRYRASISDACEGWTMTEGLRKHLESTLWRNG